MTWESKRLLQLNKSNWIALPVALAIAMLALVVIGQDRVSAGVVAAKTGSAPVVQEGKVAPVVDEGSGKDTVPAPGDAAKGGGEAAEPTNFLQNYGLMILMPVLVIVFMVMTARPQKKEQQRRDDMISSLKKNDRVVTAGGIIAKVASVRTDTKTIKLVLDEKTGSTMTVTVAAISRTLTGDEKGGEEIKD